MAKQTNYFICPCSPDDLLSVAELRDHLLSAHGVEAEGKSFKRTLAMHANCTGGHRYIYNWTITEELTVQQYIGPAS